MAERLESCKLHPEGALERQLARLALDMSAYLSPDGELDPSKVERIGCSLCHERCPEFALFEKFKFPYRQCGKCGLVYPSPRPRASFIEEQYVLGRFADSFEEIYLPSAEYRMRTIFAERVTDLIAPRQPTGRLLDVGCSSGHFLKVAANAGYEVYGVEPNPGMVSFAQTELELPNVHSGTLPSIPDSWIEFDVVTLWDVLEHVIDPSDVLAHVRRLLKPGGWAFAYTENFDSLNVFLTGALSEMFAPDVHLRHYTSRTFEREFQQAGLDVEVVYTKGLDLDHVRRTVGLNRELFPQFMSGHSFLTQHEVQDFINALGKGDNLRLIARKGER